jgi:hypothetical protein
VAIISTGIRIAIQIRYPTGDRILETKEVKNRTTFWGENFLMNSASIFYLI